MRMTLLALLLGAASPLAAQVEPPSEPRALAHAAPWQAQIYSPFTGYSEEERQGKPDWEMAHRCGGSLITPEWVLTAAHCIGQEQIANGWRVRLGARHLANGEGVTYRIDRMVRHKGYDKATNEHDIALAHIVADDATDPANPARPVRVIALYQGEALEEGVEVSATGWGKDKHGPEGRYQEYLQLADLKTLDCESLDAYRGRTTDNMLCAGAPDVDTCRGDSGGALILTYGAPVQVGIVSWGDGCGDESRPGVYVRIDNDHYRDWIARAMAVDPSVSELE